MLDASFNATFSPFLYPFSWMSGYGSPSGAFRTVSVPTYVGGEFKRPAWRKPAELEDEVMIKVVVSEVPINILLNFVVLLAVELTKMRSFYFCLVGGILGFPLGGLIGAVVGFIVGLFLILYVMPKVKGRPYATKIQNLLLGKEAHTEDPQR